MVGLLGKFWDGILDKPRRLESQDAAVKQEQMELPQVPEPRITRKIILIKKKPKHEQEEGWEAAVPKGSDIKVPACDNLLEICSC